MHAVALAGVIRQQLGPKTVLRAGVAEDAGTPHRDGGRHRLGKSAPSGGLNQGSVQ